MRARLTAPRPLSPWVYLRRNPRRVLPILAIQALVTALLVAIITPTNAFRATSETYTRGLDFFTSVTPARRSDFEDDLLAILDANPDMERRLQAKAFWMYTPMIVGKAFAPLLAIEPENQADFLDRVGLRLVRGRLPTPRTAEAAVHESVLRARGLDIGDPFGRLVDPKDGTPGRFEIAGVLAGEARLGLVDFAWASAPLSVLARTDPFQLVYAKPGRKYESDRYLRDAVDRDGQKVFRSIDAQFIRERIDEDLARLPLIFGFITISVSIVVSLVTSLLSLISFQVRVEEFGLHLALGQRRRTLVAKLSAETSVVALAGWALGLALGLLILFVYRGAALEPKGIRMHVLDARPILFSLAVPVLSALVSAVALSRRLRRMDPVAVLQRRGT